MKSLAIALVLAFAAPALAQDATTPDEVCYAWLSNAPGTVAKLLWREVAPITPALQRIGGKRRERVFACLAGAVATLHPQVREQCLTGGDPAISILAVLPSALDLCIEQSAEKPTHVLPAAPVEPDPE